MDAITKRIVAKIDDVLLKLSNTLEFCEENQRNCNLMYEGEEDYDNPWDNDIKGIKGAIEILTNIKTRETKGE